MWRWEVPTQKLQSPRFLRPEAKEGWAKIALRSLGKMDFERVRAVVFAPDSRWYNTASSTGAVQLWEAATGSEWAALPGKHDGVTCLAVSPDGRTLLVGTGANVELWDLGAGEARPAPTLRAILKGHSGDIRCAAYSADSDLLATGGTDRPIKLWGPVAAVERATLVGHTLAVNTLNFAPDGKTLVSGSEDAKVRLWHVASGREIAALDAHEGPVTCAGFSSDGKILATGGEAPDGSGEIFFWRTDPSKSR